MIQMGTVLRAMDNSGAKRAKCIKPIKCSKKLGAKGGDRILVSLKSIRTDKKLKRGELHWSLITRIKKIKKRFDGSCIWFNFNNIMIINLKRAPLSTRAFGPIYMELKWEKDLRKLVGLAGMTV